MGRAGLNRKTALATLTLTLAAEAPDLTSSAVIGLAQEGMKRCDDGHFHFANQRQQMASGGPAVNPKLVLNAYDVYIADVNEVRRTLVGG